MSSLEAFDAGASGVDLELVSLGSNACISIDTSDRIEYVPADYPHPFEPHDAEQPMLETTDVSPRFDLDHLLISLEKPPKPSWLHIIFRYTPRGSLLLRPTSWLDGVRGIAALGVFIFHTIALWASPYPLWDPETHNINIVQLPFVRTILVSGGPSVCLFFVVSGYVLTYKCLSWLREGYPEKRQVAPSVASSAFRRGFRLYLPLIILTFSEMVLTRFGIPPPMSYGFDPAPTFLSQFLDWIYALNRFVNPFYNFWGAIRGNAVGIRYDPVVWTIPLEYYGSLVCYLLLLVFTTIRKDWIRMFSVAILSLIGFTLGFWSLFCFLAGMLIADFNPQGLHDADSLAPSRGWKTYIWWLVFTISFYIAGFPSLMNETLRDQPSYGFSTLRTLTPPLAMEDQARFWWSLSSIFMLFSISQLASLKTIFESSFCQYLGKLAFSVYLLHAISLQIFGIRFQKWLLSVTGLEVGDGTLVYWLAAILWYVPFSVVVFLWAAWFEKWVDAGSVKFAKWLEGKCREWWRGWKGWRGISRDSV